MDLLQQVLHNLLFNAVRDNNGGSLYHPLIALGTVASISTV